MQSLHPGVGKAVSESQFVLREDVDGVCILTFDRPQTRNALSEAMLAELSRLMSRIAEQSHTRAVVLAATGSAFSAGHDLKEIARHRGDHDGGRDYMRRLIRSCNDLMQRIVRLPQPVIAAVEGVATAAGCQLVATCDLAVASRTARFATPGVHIGLFCSTPMVALSRNVAPKHALEMLLTGDAISSEEAHRIGLINRVVEPGLARDAALTLARQIAAKSRMTVRTGKEAFYRQLTMTLADAYEYAGEVMIENLMARDAAEGIGAFVAKRAPKWEDC